MNTAEVQATMDELSKQKLPELDSAAYDAMIDNQKKCRQARNTRACFPRHARDMVDGHSKVECAAYTRSH